MSDISHIVATPYSSPLQTAELGIAGRNNDGQELTWPEGAARLEGHGPNITVPHQVPAWHRVLWGAFSNSFNYV